jgi:hypothetical protein
MQHNFAHTLLTSQPGTRISYNATWYTHYLKRNLVHTLLTTQPGTHITNNAT